MLECAYQLFLGVISIGEKPIKKGHTNKRRHDDNISDALRVQHVILQGMYRIFHGNNISVF